MNVRSKNRKAFGPKTNTRVTQRHQPAVVVIVDDYECHSKVATRRRLSWSGAISGRNTEEDVTDGCGGFGLTIFVEKHGAGGAERWPWHVGWQQASDVVWVTID
uniref:Uncharacterized protein n=1 Tax=Oryza barthii TaxID=65489 RepID=A0A0D3HKG8_9ORYZ